MLEAFASKQLTGSSGPLQENIANCSLGNPKIGSIESVASCQSSGWRSLDFFGQDCSSCVHGEAQRVSKRSCQTAAGSGRRAKGQSPRSCSHGNADDKAWFGALGKIRGGETRHIQKTQKELPFRFFNQL